MSINLSATTPAAPAGMVLATPQADGLGNISIAVPSSSSPSGAAGGDLSGTYPNPTVAKVNGGSVPASQAFVGTDSSSRIVAATAGALPNGTTATTQTQGDGSTKVATDLYVDTGLATKQASLTGTGIARNTGVCSELSGAVTTSGSNATTIQSSISLPGSPTTTTQTAGDNSTKIATTAYVDAPASGGTPIKCIPFSCNIFPEAGPGLTIMGTSNTQEEVYFVMDEDFTITNVYLSVGTGVAGATFGVAIYDATGTTKLTAADSFSIASSNTILKQVLSSSVTLKKKTGYWLAWTWSSGGSPTFYNVLMGAGGGFQGLYNKNVVRSGNSGTATSGGATNANIGTVSSAQLRIPVLYFD